MESGNTTASINEVRVKQASPLRGWFPLIVIICSFALSFTVFYTVFSDGKNFEGGVEEEAKIPGWTRGLDSLNQLMSGIQPQDTAKRQEMQKKIDAWVEAEPDPTHGHPLNFRGTVYKGGFVIPIAMGIMIIMFIFVLERFFALFILASGKGSNDVFAQRIRLLLSENDIDGAIAACDRQRGSVASVVRAGLVKYKEVSGNQTMDFEQKKAAIQGALEEATSLELPGLERNLVILATSVSIGVLVGLLGTVLGMIKAFQALATSGVPDAAQLATGISEALINTAMGILTSTVAIVMYNFFTTRIDKITYSIDETGYSVVQTFEKNHAHK